MAPNKKKKKRGKPRCPVHNIFITKEGRCKRCTEENEKENIVNDANVQVCASERGEITSLGSRSPLQKKNRYNLRHRPHQAVVDSYISSDSDVEEVMAPTDGISSTQEMESLDDGQESSDEFCMNCRRLVEGLKSTPSDQIRFSKKGCSMSKMEGSVNLCNECHNYLRDRKNEWKFGWPSVMWKMFCHADNEVKALSMWKFVSMPLRRAWIGSYREISVHHQRVSLSSPSPYFFDATEDVLELEQIKRGRYRLGDLFEWHDRHCYCSVKCPWGCDTFIEDTGKIPFDVVLRDLLHVEVQVMSNTRYKSLNRRNVLGSIRKDFLSGNGLLLKRKTWPIRPAVRLVEGYGLVLLTCPEHDGGTTLKYVHPPVNPATESMPAAMSDQVAHAVVAPRTLKTIKANKYSDSYQVVNCSGGYDGLDSCVVLEGGRFDFTSWISERNEDLYISQRPDMRAKLDQLVMEGKIPSWLRDDKLEHDIDWNSDEYRVKMDDALLGSTNVGIGDVIGMCRAMNETDYSVNEYVDDNTGERKIKNFRPPWPKMLSCCHPVDERGEKFPDVVPMQQSCDARLLWVMVTMMVSCPPLWSSVVASVHTDSRWPGWILLYATRYVLPFPFPCGRDEDNPYRGNISVRTAMEMLDAAYEEEPFSSMKLVGLLEMLPRVDCLTAPCDFDNLSGFDPIEADVVFLIGGIDEEECIVPLTFVVMDGGGKRYTYEQVYKVSTSGNVGECMEWSNWKACAYMRHAQFSFEKCWKMERKKTTTKSRFPRGGEWDCIMFVKTTSSEDELRRMYLEYMGSETKLMCPFHKFCYTVTPSRSDMKCVMAVDPDGDDEAVCGRVAVVECPLSTCDVALCRVHQDSEEELMRQCMAVRSDRMKQTLCDGSDDEVGVVVGGEEVVSADGLSDGDESSVSMGCPDVECGDSLAGGCAVIVEESDDDETVNSDESPFVFKNDNAPNEEDELVSVDSNKEAFLPFTAAQPVDGINVKMKTTSRFDVVGLHVLLNKFGSLLQRKGRQLIGSKGEQGFLQRIVATSSGCSIPLAYPEAMLFPSIFWKQYLDGSFPGAMPSCLWRGEKQCKKYGYAGALQHILTRLKNSDLQCSTNHRYIFFGFDIMNNLMSYGCDNRVILRRGFEHMIGSNGVKSVGDASLMNKDLVDNRSQVNKLAAALCEYGESGDALCPSGPYAHKFGRTMFFTHTCNQDRHPGVAPIRQWLNFLLEYIDEKYSDNSQACEEYKQTMRQVAAVQIIRSWRRVARALIEYMVRSKEYRMSPSGQTILLYWYRFEDGQQSPGALPHIHAIFFLREDKNDAAQVGRTERSIRCSVRDIIDPIEASRYVKEGLLSCVDDMYDVQDDAARMQKHRCKRPRCVKMTGDGGEKSNCRNPDYAKINPHPAMYGLKKIVPKHSERACNLFEKMGLASLNPDTGDVCYIDDRLQFGKVVYPADHGEHFVPCLSRMFVATRSTSNAQLCTYYMNSRYLANYNAGVDDNHRIFLRGGKEENTLQLEHEEVANTKIASNRIFQSKQEKRSRQRRNIKGRPLGLPEAVSNMLGQPQIYTDINFVFVPTVPMEERPAHDRQARSTEMGECDDETNLQYVDKDPEAMRVRKMLGLPSNRQFSKSEVATIKDALGSTLTVDKITAYGCRPPELRFVDSPSDYYKCFSRQPYERPRKVNCGDEEEEVYISTSERLLHSNLYRCAWVDGLDCQVLVRPCAIRMVIGLPKCVGPMKRLFQWLKEVDDYDQGYVSEGFSTFDGPIENFISSDDDEDGGNYSRRVHTVCNERNHWHDKQEGRCRRRSRVLDSRRNSFRIERSVALGTDSERSLSSLASMQPSWIVDDSDSVVLNSVGSSGLVDTEIEFDLDDDSWSYDILSDSHSSLAIGGGDDGDEGCSSCGVPCITMSQKGLIRNGMSAEDGMVSSSRQPCIPPSEVCWYTGDDDVSQESYLYSDDQFRDGGGFGCESDDKLSGSECIGSRSDASVDYIDGESRSTLLDGPHCEDSGICGGCGYGESSISGSMSLRVRSECDSNSSCDSDCESGSSSDIDSLSSSESSSTATTVVAIFGEQDRRRSTLRYLFIDKSYKSHFMPVVIYNSVRPTRANRFIIHVLLSMGRFNNEMELFEGKTIRDYFQNAGLLRRSIGLFPPNEDDVLQILKEYVMKQLLFIPGGTTMFNRLLLAAYDSLYSAIVDNDIVSNDIPPFFYSTLRLVASEKCKQFQDCLRFELGHALVNALPNLPEVNCLILASKANPLSWDPELERLEGQSLVSYDESVNALAATIGVVNDYLSGKRRCTKNFIVIGPPGTGKTFQMLMGVAYAMSRGLTVCVTALQGDRANSIGGRHIHFQFGMPKMGTLNVQKMVEATVCNLQRQPEKIHFIRQMDVLGIDELSLPSAEHMSCLDMVFRYYRNSSSYFGGILLICSMDHCQMPPVCGRPSLLSPHILTSYDIMRLEHPIRSRRDRNLMRLIELTRKRVLLTEELEEICKIIKMYCTHVPDWNDKRIEPDIVRVFGRRVAALKAEQDYFDSVRRSGIHIVSRDSEDIQSAVGSHGSWQDATEATSRLLSGEVNEVQHLHLYKGMLVEMTFNNNKEHWAQSQMGILLDLPNQQTVDDFLPIEIYLAPPSVRVLPSVELTKENLRHRGWRVVKVGPVPDREVVNLGRGLVARRRQYGIRPRISCTIHKIMGSEVEKLITQVTDDKDSIYRIWQCEQVQVLISRTFELRNLFFVGDPDETAAAICRIVQKRGPFADYIEHVIEQKSALVRCDDVFDATPIIHQSLHPFRPCDIELPDDKTGFVYVMLSLKDDYTTVIGTATNLLEKMNHHNRGYSTCDGIDPDLRPWHVICFVVGFHGDKDEMELLRSEWEGMKNSNTLEAMSPSNVVSLGNQIIGKNNSRFEESGRDILLQLVSTVDFEE